VVKHRGSQPRAGGWKQWKEPDARRALAAWRLSGLSVAAFCAREGYSETRLRYWSTRLEDQQAERSTTVSFVPVALEKVGRAGHIEIERNGVVLRLREDLDVEHVARREGSVQRRISPEKDHQRRISPRRIRRISPQKDQSSRRISPTYSKSGQERRIRREGSVRRTRKAGKRATQSVCIGRYLALGRHRKNAEAQPTVFAISLRVRAQSLGAQVP